MAHTHQRDFIDKIKRKSPEYFSNKTVLEIGSLNINGTVRDFFENCKYVGIDVAEGNCVDVVCEGQKYDAPDNSYDVVCSAECFEHNPYWLETFENMIRLCKPGGFVFFTCATEGRPEHGTSRSTPLDSPLTVDQGWEYYRNLNESDFQQFINFDDQFKYYGFEVNEESKDLYFWGIKKMNKLNNFPPVYYISLEDQHERQSSMNLQLDLLGIEDKTMVTAYDGRIIDYRNNELVEGLYFHQMDSGQIAVGMSHLKAIKEWYYNSNTDYAVFLEDDVTFESSQYWNFTWTDILTHLPKNWQVIQLALIKEDGVNETDMKFHSRPWWNWSAGAYVIKREYAKILIDEYCDNNRYNLKIYNDLGVIPLVENVIYAAAGPAAYTLPLFTENTKHLSTFYPNLIEDTHKGGQIKDSQFILNWWKTKGNEISLEKLMGIEDTTNLLYDFILDSQNPEKNHNLASYYENIGQTASAISYYLRTAERTQDKLLQYESLLRASICFDKQGSRNFTVKGLLQNSIAILPKRPEAYYLLAKFYSKENKDGCWNDCYLISAIAEDVVDRYCEPLNSDVSYSGFYGILYYKALSGWWCGLCGESKKIFTKLLIDYELSNDEIEVCKEYLNK